MRGDGFCTVRPRVLKYITMRFFKGFFVGTIIASVSIFAIAVFVQGEVFSFGELLSPPLYLVILLCIIFGVGILFGCAFKFVHWLSEILSSASE